MRLISKHQWIQEGFPT